MVGDTFANFYVQYTGLVKMPGKIFEGYVVIWLEVLRTYAKRQK